MPDVVKHLTAECNVQPEIKSATDIRRRDTSKNSVEAKQYLKGSEKVSEDDLMGVHADSEAIDAVHNPWVTSVNLNKRAIR